MVTKGNDNMRRSSNGPAHICYLASRIAPRVGNSAAKSPKFPGPNTCTSYFAPAYPAHGLAFVAEKNNAKMSVSSLLLHPCVSF